MNRREFIKTSAKTTLGAAALSALSTRVSRANDKPSPSERFRIGIAGVHHQVLYLTRAFANLPDVDVAYVCDVDKAVIGPAVEAITKSGRPEPKVVGDFRKILDDKSVDIFVHATPDHWHAPATILACEAEKHVYVEKPCAHNLREGRLMIEAARRKKRVIQVGTQSRSNERLIKAIARLHDGAIGDVLVAKAWDSQLRENIGHVKPSDPPASLDYDMWLGPAPSAPYRSNVIHSHWRWWHDYGVGDIGNDGIHDLDMARYGLGMNEHPSTITAVGGKYFFDDDQQWPDTQTVVFEYPGDGKLGHKRQLIYEQRIWSPYMQESHENGNAFYGTKGVMIFGKKEGYKLYGPKNELKEQDSWSLSIEPHARNFLNCIKDGKEPNASIEIGHLSASLSHLGNIATRVGHTIHFDPKTEQIKDDAEASKFLRRTYREGHWAVPKDV
jgi:predicted dehydrogenase